MATTAVMNSSVAGVYVGGTLIAQITDGSITIAGETRDVSNKTTGAWAARLEAGLSWSISASAMYVPNSSWSAEDAFAALSGRTTVTVLWGSSEAGDIEYSGSAYITNINLNSAGSNDNVVYDVNFEGTGAITEAATT
jgi:hypothetical protein